MILPKLSTCCFVADLPSNNFQTLLPLDTPLVMTNAIDYNSWETTRWTWNGFLASMPVNHYWSTTFSTSQRGFLRLRYRFVSAHGFSHEEQAMPVEALGWRSTVLELNGIDPSTIQFSLKRFAMNHMKDYN
ncbi:MAG: hypothetical protein ABI413_17810 [Ktedonobacteraceae bacterium]